MFRKRIAIAAVAAALLTLFAGCGGTAETTEITPLTREVSVYEGEGYRLTYPACFTPVQETARMVNFTVSGRSMAFTLSVEENPYGERAIDEYPRLMGIYGAKTLDAHSFGVEKYQPGVLSAYYLYAFSGSTQYLLEYNFGGEEEQRALEELFAVEIVEDGDTGS